MRSFFRSFNVHFGFFNVQLTKADQIPKSAGGFRGSGHFRNVQVPQNIVYWFSEPDYLNGKHHQGRHLQSTPFLRNQKLGFDSSSIDKL